MRTIFADTSYWIAITSSRDTLHRQAIELTNRLGDYKVVTSEMVLVEVLNAFSGSGGSYREAVVRLVHAIIDNPHVEIIPRHPNSSATRSRSMANGSISVGV